MSESGVFVVAKRSAAARISGAAIGWTAASIPKADCEPPLTIMCDAIDCRQVAKAMMASATTLRRGDRKRSQSAITQARPSA